ncbi:hypothetical protein [Streptomyces sp. Tu 3180]|uniref:hypothetical protein n=1 Tax=Streptomyces sp. Tu 3180 TaxID=2682611 RepID=UPI001357C2D1|nr:hypothetical protein [Streptomyces sp. Tu 3180]KAF3466125.1 hypothetical protein GL259_18495 [Streptomyces sp. Tu 3180]
MVLSYDEDRTFAALSPSRFGAGGSSRLDWRGAEALRSSPAFDGAQLRKTLLELAGPDEPAVVFWGNPAVPSTAVEAGLVARHADAVLADCYECRVHLVDSEVLIEFRDGEGSTAGRVPR